MAKADYQLLYGLAAFKALIGKRVGVETCVEILSRAGYGEFSARLGRALHLSSRGMRLVEALRRVSDEAGSREMRQALRMISDAIGSPSPGEFVSSAFEEIRASVEKRVKAFIESIPGLAEVFYIVAFLFPILAISGVLLISYLGPFRSMLRIPDIEPGAITLGTTILLGLASALIIGVSWRRGR